jgi:acyl carrier protein
MSKFSREEIAFRVKEILKNNLSLNDLDVEGEDKKIISDLGADSLDTIELIMAFEREFEVMISDDVAQNITTINDCIETVLNCLNNCK